MYAISLYQPWASAMFVPRGPGLPMLKQVETRTWPCYQKVIGQRIAIHATRLSLAINGVAEQKKMWRSLKENETYRAAFAAHGWTDFLELPRGGIIGTVVVQSSESTIDLLARGAIDEAELFFGNYLQGRFGWITSDPVEFPEMYKYSGRQKMFIWDEGTSDEDE